MKLERTVEAAWPYVFGGLILAVWRCALESTFPDKIDGLLGASGTVAAVLIGFLSTAKAVLLGLSSSEALKALRGAGFLNLFYRYIFEAIWGGIAFLVLVTLGFFVASPEGAAPYWYTAGWVFLASVMVAQYVRVTQLFFALLRKV
jgi:hypothetical protein